MKKSLLRYRDLPSVCVRTSLLLPGATQCALRSHGIDHVNMMLLGAGIVSIFAMRTDPGDDIAEALARVVTRHALGHSPADPTLVADIKAQAADRCPGLAWSDLAVGVSAPRCAGRVTCYPLSTPGSAALVLSTDDSVMPVSFVACTTPRPSRELLLAVGRTLLGHHECLLVR